MAIPLTIDETCSILSTMNVTLPVTAELLIWAIITATSPTFKVTSFIEIPVGTLTTSTDETLTVE